MSGSFNSVNQPLTTFMNLFRALIWAAVILLLSASAVLAQVSTITPGDPGNFITIWNTENSGSSNNDQIRIPHANGVTYNFTLYWEDTTNPSVNGTETFTTPFFTVTFPDPGIYRVEITGDFPRIFFAGSGDRLKILSVEQWGDIEWSSMENAFRRASNLEINATDAPDLSNVTSMARMFEDASSVNSDLNNWDVSNVTDMRNLFDGARAFNGNISSWNVSSVTSMTEMFNNAREFNKDIGAWNTTTVTGNGMLQMFQNARAFNQDISGWDVSGITNMRRMFNGAIEFNQDIGYDEGTGEGWDVSNVTTMSGMFQNAEKFNGDISGWEVSSVTDMGALFNGAGDFNQDLNGWNVSNVSSMSDMFRNATSFDGDISGWETGSVSNMNSMFNGASVFNRDISGWNTENVTEMYQMFRNASAFNQNLGSWNVEEITGSFSMTNLFDNTAISRPNYDGILTGWATQNVNSGITLGVNGLEYCAEGARSTLIDKGWILDGDTPAASCPVITDPFTTTWNTENPGESSNDQIRIPLFGNGYDFTIDWGDGSEESYVLNPGMNTPHFIEHTYSSPGIYTVEIRGDFPRIYFNNSGDKEKILSVESWGEIVWDEMEFAFYGASNLEINALDTPDLTNVISLYSMFRDAASMNSSLNQWDVSGIENMAEMFYGASSFNQNLDNWETGNVEKMESMFRDAAAFDRDIGMWDISNVLLMENMLSNSGLSVGNYDAILSGWSGQTVQSNITLGSDGLQYCFSQAEHDILTNAPNSWTISGDSVAAGCSITSMDPFITIWDTDDNDIEIPTTGSGYNYAVYWEKTDDAGVNGTLLANTGDLTISLPQQGVYRVEIYEDFPRIHFASFDYPDSEKEKLISIEQWGDIEWSSMAFAFYGAVNLEINATDAPDLSNVTSLEGMFGEAVKLNSDLNHWDVSNIETMRRMFQGKFDEASAFNGDISNWDVDNVTDMQQMFQYATSFNRDIGGWDVSSVENMRQMFDRAENFDQDIGYDSGTGEGWDVSSVTDISGMFMNAPAFNQDIGGWDVSNVTNMGEFDGVSGGAFENATSFDQDLSGWDITGVTGDFGNDMFKLFDNSGLSRENYDKLLEAWSDLVDANDGPKGLNLGAAGLTYCAETARDNLIDNHGWTIDGDAVAGDCVSPQVVSASNSEVTATTSHTADGVDQSTVTVVLRDEEDDPISGFADGDFSIEVTGSASASAVTETGTAGTYSFTVTNTAEEIITVTVTADGTELDDEPTIDFGAPPQVVDAENSEVTATSPHLADGVDTSVATVVVRDEADDAITGLVDDDFEIEMTGSAVAADVSETGIPGTYSFTINNTEVETVTLTVTADGVELDDQPEIIFEAAVQIVSASNSEVMATTPHTADGVDQSTVTVILRDEEDDPISGFTSANFSIEVTGSASDSEITETGTPGTYSFTVTNSVAEIVTVTITASGTALDDEPTIDFEAAPQVVSATNSEVTATTPHIADGTDASIVTVVLRDEEDDPITGFPSWNFLIELTGSAAATEIVETAIPGTYGFSVTNTVVEIVAVTVTATGTELDDNPEITFEAPPPQVVDATLSEVTATTPHAADGTDQSIVTVVLRDEEDDLITGFTAADFSIAVSGSALATEITETVTAGTYQFSVTNSEAEVVSVTVTADGVELDDMPEIDFESPIQVVDGDNSEIEASTPHVADGSDPSVVTLIIVDLKGDPISGLTDADFTFSLKGVADVGSVSETEKPGVYTSLVVSKEPGSLLIEATVKGVRLKQTAKITFESPEIEVDARESSVSASSPHVADGEDESIITIKLIDNNGDAVTGLDATNFSFDLPNGTSASQVRETRTGGIYQFTVVSTRAGIAEFKIVALGVILEQTARIEFTEPEPIVDAVNSSVTATSPHIADGEDGSIVTVTLRDPDGSLIPGVSGDQFTISLSGGSVISGPSETDSGVYQFEVVSNFVGQVSVTVSLFEVDLADKAVIEFEPIPAPVPDALVITGLQSDGSVVKISWQPMNAAFIENFIIYRGEPMESLQPIEVADADAASFEDAIIDGSSFNYQISAVNVDGEEGPRSNVVTFNNSLIVADNTEWRLVSSPLDAPVSNPGNITLFSFSNQYMLSDELEPMHGYWIKSGTFDSETIQVTGSGITDASVNLQEGWNLIGSPANQIQVGSISDPDGILSDAPVYGYFETGYAPVEELRPNHGYWIHANESGIIEFDLNADQDPVEASLMLNRQSERQEITMPAIEFIAGGRSQKLWLGDHNVDGASEKKYLLPPISPDPVLDVRTESGLSIIKQPQQRLLVQSSRYPVQVTLSDDNQNPDFVWRLVLQDNAEEQILNLFPGQPALIGKPFENVQLQKIHTDDLIAEHRLMPNYPNPFNPSTTIRYQLREQVQVKIEVFDAMGRRVQTLRNERQTSGEYSVRFNAAHLSTGIYFVRLAAGSAIHIQKITLIK
jgi:surface protein